jgi:hypothetical protein
MGKCLFNIIMGCEAHIMKTEMYCRPSDYAV